MRKINMKRKGRKEKVEQENDDEQNGVEETSDPKNASEEEEAKNSEDEAKDSGEDAKNTEEDAEPEPEAKRRKSDKRKKAAKKDEEEASEDEPQYEVEEVLKEKMVKGVRHYLIRWKGYEPESDTWEPESTLKCPELIKKFKDKATEKNGAESAKKNKKSKKDKPKKEKKVVKKGSKVQDVNWESDEEFEVGSILDMNCKKNGKREFLVSWKGYSHAQDSWEPEENLDCTDLIKKFTSKVESAKNVGKKKSLNTSGSGKRLSRR